MNLLHYGDCFTIMAEWPDACVDLIYLDPPLDSNRQYNAIYRDETGRPLPDQIEASCDRLELDEEREWAIRTLPMIMRDNGIEDATVEFWKLWMHASGNAQPQLLADLSYMMQRLLVMKRILKPTGSIYFHCDPTSSHYIKVLMDGIFGHENFQSEITWKRSSAPKGAKGFGQVRDVMLYYSQSARRTWNPVSVPHEDPDIERSYPYQDERGRYRRQDIVLTDPKARPDLVYEYQGYTPEWGWRMERSELEALDADGRLEWSSSGRPYRKTYLPGGQNPTNLWTNTPSAQGTEGMRYPTQKPPALLERIISASSNPGDVVLDPFCGCATTLEAAHKLGRQWIGIDIAFHAVNLVARARLQEGLGLKEGQDFIVKGVPRTLEEAQDLWRRDKYHFQRWAVEHVEGFVSTKQTADGDLDGRIYFTIPGEQDLQSMVVEVKGGKNVNIKDWRSLKEALSREGVLLAGLIVMEPLGGAKSRNFRREAMDLKPLNVLGIDYPRMQILTVGEILDGKSFHIPAVGKSHLGA